MFGVRALQDIHATVMKEDTLEAFGQRDVGRLMFVNQGS